MIVWVDARLKKWGEFIHGGRGSGGIACAPAYQQVHIRGTAGCSDPVGTDVMEIDRILAKLKQTQPKLFVVARGLYVDGVSPQTIAGRSRCHLDTVYARRDSLHEHVANQVSTRHSK